MPQPYRPLADGQGGMGRNPAVIGQGASYQPIIAPIGRLLAAILAALRVYSGIPVCHPTEFSRAPIRHCGLPPCRILKGAISACLFRALRGGIPCHQNAPLRVLCSVSISHPQGVLRSRIITPSGWCTAMVLLYPAGAMLHPHGPPRLATHCRRIGSLGRHSGTSIH